MKNELAVLGVEPSTHGTGGDSFNNHTTSLLALRLVLLGLKFTYLLCVAISKSVILQIGDCAETKTQTGKRQHENANMKMLLKMAPKAFIFGSITEVSLAK